LFGLTRASFRVTSADEGVDGVVQGAGARVLILAQIGRTNGTKQVENTGPLSSTHEELLGSIGGLAIIENGCL